MPVRRDVAHERAELDLKIATGRLLGANGGPSSAAEGSGSYQQRLSDCQARNTDVFLRIDEVGRLEDMSFGQPGWPHVTQALCRRQSGIFLPLLEPGAPAADWSGHSARLCKEMGELLTGLGGALADDRDVGPSEARKLIGDSEDLLRAAAELNHALKARAGSS